MKNRTSESYLKQLKPKLSWLIPITLLIFSAMLRFYQLGQVPHGMTWDEAAIGYNGMSVLTTRRDEWLQRFPTSFRSFGDYKAPLAIYLNGFFTLVFGMNLAAVRLPFVLSGVAGVVGFYFLILEILRRFPYKKIPPHFLAGIGAAMMMISPWHLHFTRTGFESGMSLTFLIWGLWSLSKYLNLIEKQTKSRNYTKKYYLHQYLSAILLTSGMYTYHSAKVVVPILSGLVALSWWRYFRPTKTKLKKLFTWVAIVAILLIPMGMDSFRGEGLERAGDTILFSKDLSFSNKTTQILSNFTAHFTPDYLLKGSTTTLRHGSGAWGVLLPTTYFLCLLSLVSIFITRRPNRKVQWLGLIWILVGTLPASIGFDVPHSNRALLSLPGFMLLALDGAIYLYQTILQSNLNKKILGSHGEENVLPKLIFGMITLIHLIFVIIQQHHYYTVFAKESASDFQDGYLEAFSYVVPLEQGHGTEIEYDKVLYTTDYGQPYIYALFVRQTNPLRYRQGALVKYMPDEQIGVGDLAREKTIIMASGEDDLPLDKADKVVYGSDGSVRFKIYLTD